MVRICSDADVAAVLDVEDLLHVVEYAFKKQGRGEVERPDRPHYPVGPGLSGTGPEGTALTMPAYIHGADYAVTKLVTVHEGNADRDLPTVNAQLALTAADTGVPAGYMAGTRVTNVRTGCIGGLAARHLARDGPVTLGLVGAGRQAHWQARAIDAATDLDEVRIYSPSDSRKRTAETLGREGMDARAVPSAEEAVAGASVVITATTATEPVFPPDALAPGALVVAVGAYTEGMQELSPLVFDRAARAFADVPEEAAETGDTIAAGVTADDLTPLSAVFEGEAGRETENEILVVKSVGSAVLDAAAAEHVFDRAEAADVGTEVDL